MEPTPDQVNEKVLYLAEGHRDAISMISRTVDTLNHDAGDEYAIVRIQIDDIDQALVFAMLDARQDAATWPPSGPAYESEAYRLARQHIGNALAEPNSPESRLRVIIRGASDVIRPLMMTASAQGAIVESCERCNDGPDAA